MIVRSAYQRWRELRQQKRWIRWGEDAFIILAVVAAVMAWQTRNLVSSGQPAPSFELRDLEGRVWALDQLRGKKVVLHFWAPWCGVCKAETGTLSRLRKAAPAGTEVLSVALAYDDVADVRGFVQAQGVDYPVLLGDDRMMAAYRVNAFPTTYFISEEGKIRRAAVGYTTGFGLRWRLWF